MAKKTKKSAQQPVRSSSITDIANQQILRNLGVKPAEKKASPVMANTIAINDPIRYNANQQIQRNQEKYDNFSRYLADVKRRNEISHVNNLLAQKKKDQEMVSRYDKYLQSHPDAKTNNDVLQRGKSSRKLTELNQMLAAAKNRQQEIDRAKGLATGENPTGTWLGSRPEALTETLKEANARSAIKEIDTQKQRGAWDDQDNVRLWSDEKRKGQRATNETALTALQNQIDALNKEKETYIPFSTNAQIVDRLMEAYVTPEIQNELNILNGPGYTEEQKQTAQKRLDALRNKNRGDVENFVGYGLYNQFTDLEDKRDFMSRQLYDRLYGYGSYDRDTAGMTAEEKQATDDRMINALIDVQTPYGRIDREMAQAESRMRYITEQNKQIDNYENQIAKLNELTSGEVTGDTQYHPENNIVPDQFSYFDKGGKNYFRPVDQVYNVLGGGLENVDIVTGDYHEAALMDDDQRARFISYYNEGKYDEAWAFYQGLQPFLNQYSAMFKEASIEDTAMRLPGLSSVASLLATPVQTAEFIQNLPGQIKALLYDGEYEPAADANSYAYTATNVKNITRNKISQALGSWGWVYQGAMSGADSALNAAIGKGLGLTGNALQYGVLGLFGTQAFETSLQNNMATGSGNFGYDFMEAFIDAAIETATEIWSVENWLADPSNLLTYVGKIAISEPSEEIAGAVFGPYIKELLGHKNEWKVRADEIYNQGYYIDENGQRVEVVKLDEAKRQAMREWNKEIYMSALSALVSVGPAMFYGGGQIAMNTYNTGSQVQKQAGGVQQALAAARAVELDSTTGRMMKSIQDKAEKGQMPGKYKTGRLVENVARAAEEQEQTKAETALKDSVMQEMEGKDLQGVDPEEVAKVIVKAITGGSESLSKAERSMLLKDAVINIFKNYMGATEQTAKAIGAQLDATEAERKAQKSLAEIFKPAARTTNTGDNVVHGATAEKIRLAEQVSEHIKTGTEVLLDGKFQKLDGVEVTKDKDGKYSLQAVVDGKAVPAAAIKATGSAVGRIVGEASINPEFFSKQFTETLLKAQEEGKIKDPDRNMNEAKQIRMYAYMGFQMPATSLDYKLASQIYKDSAEEHGQNRKAQAAEGNRKEQGRITFDGAEYGTKEWNTKVKSLDSAARNQMDAIAGIAQRAGIEVDFTDLNDTTVYGSENRSGIRINVAGLNYGSISGEATSRHNMVVTFGHEMTHWLQRNSMRGYNRLEQFVMQQYRQTQGENELTRRLNHHMIQWGLSLEDAMSEIVADSCDQILANETVMQHIQETDKNLYTEVKGFVKNLVDRIKQAVTGMSGSASRDARALAQSANEVAKVWLGAYDEALTGVAAENTEEGTERLSRAGTDPDTGRSVYISNYAQDTQEQIKRDALISLIQNIWSKKPITLQISENGKQRTIQAQYNPDFDVTGARKTDVGKMAYPKYGPASSRRVMMNLANDYYDILEESNYLTSAEEQKNHKDVMKWHYFINDIYYADQGSDEAIPYRVQIDVKEMPNGNYVYNYKPTELKNEQRKKLSVMGIGPVNTGVMSDESASASNESAKAGSKAIDAGNKEQADTPSTPDIINDMASRVKLDQEYEDAAGRGDIKKTTEMLLKKLADTQGVIPFMAPEWDAGNARETAKLLKVADPEAIATAADKMSDYVPDNAVLIPMPGHEGKLTADSWSVKLAEAISERTGRPVVIALEGAERESRQKAKGEGRTGASQEELGFRQVEDLQTGTFPIFVDNIVGSGVTADAARQAIGGGITLAYAKSLRSPGLRGLKNLTVTHESIKNGGGLIPLSERLNVEKQDVRYSRSEESYDVEAWLGNMTYSGLQTEDERILMETFKGLRVSMSLALHKQVLYQSRIKELESRTVLDADARHELETLRQKLEGQRWRMEQLEKEMADVTSQEGYAGMMYKHNMLFKDFIDGKTQEQVTDKVNELMDQVKDANRDIEKQTAEMRKLAQTQAVKTMKSYLGKTSLDRMATTLKKQYNSAMPKTEVEDRLAYMALKLADGQDIQADAEGLAADLVNKMRGIRSESLEALRGTKFIIGQSLFDELKAENSTMKEIREAVRGSGVLFTVNQKENTKSRIVEQWNELRENNQSLPDVEGMAEIDALHTIVDYIASELKASTGSEQYTVDMAEATAMAYAGAASVTTFLVNDPQARSQIRNLMNQIKEISDKTGDIADNMEQLQKKMQNTLEAAVKVKGWSEALQADMKTAISYYNKTAAVAAQTERKKVKEGLIKQLRSENTRKLIEQQEKYRQMMKDDREARETAQKIQGERYKINTNIRRLKNLLTAETDQKNIPEEAKPLARMMSKMLVLHDQSDMRKVLLADSKQLADFAERLDRMDKANGDFDPERDLDFLVIKAPNAEDNDYTLRDKVWHDLMDIESGLLEYRNAEGQGKVSLKDRAAALEKIQKAVSEISTVIKRRGEAFISGKRYEVAALAEQFENEAQASRFKGERRGRGSGVMDTIEKALKYGNLTPEYFIKNLRNGVMSLLFEGFHDAEQDSGLEARDAQERMAKIAEETGFATWDGQQKHTIKVSGGREITITTEQLMALYATWLREKNAMRPEATAHLLNGGFVLAESETNKGKPRREIIERRPVRMSAEQLDALGKELTDQQRAYVDAVIEYMSTDLAEIGNRASMDAYGIRKFTEQYYFPIKSWRGVMNQSSDRGVNNKNDNRAMRQSFTKRITAGAQNAIEISDFTPTAVKHIVGMITFNTVGPAVENMNKVLNQQLTFGEKARDEAGEVVEDSTYKTNMGAAFQEHYGKAAYDYLVQFMQDVNGGVTQRNETSLRESLLTLFKKSAVAGSLSVAAQQPLSYIRASLLINPKYLAAAISPQYWKGSYAEMLQYSGVAVIKAMGKFDMNYGRSMIDYITPEGMQKNKAKAAYEWVSDKSTKLPEIMDNMTWTRMWTAVKLEQAAKNPGVDMKSEAFLQQVAERFNELMRRTQVYDSVMVKSQNMRSSSYLKKVATSFMAEPTLSLNVLADAWQNIRTPGGKKQAAKALAAFLLSAAAQAGAKAFFGAGRSPDKKKTKKENFLNKFGYNLLSEVNPLGLIPGYSQLINVLADGELKDDAMGVIGKAVESVDRIFNLATGQTKKGTYRDLEDSLGQLVQYATNIPAKNIMRDFRAMVNWFSGGTAAGFTGDSYAQRETSGVVLKYQFIDTLLSEDLLGLLNDRLMDAGYDTSAKGYVQRLYDAQKAGDKKQAEDLNEYLTLAFGKEQKNINSQVNSLVKSDESTSVEEKQRLLKENEYGSMSSWVLDQYREGSIDRKKAEALYREERPKATDKDVLEALDKVDYEKRTGKKVDNYSNYTPLYDAIEENRTEKIREALKYMMENGYKKEDIKRQLTTKYKQAYLDADLDGRRRIRDAIQKAYKAMGYTATDADKIINGWKSEKKK